MGTRWEEQYNAMRNKVIAQIRNEAMLGDPVALIALGEKYLSSTSQIEIAEGFKLLDEAEAILRSELSGEDSSFVEEALVHMFNTKGEKLEEIYLSTGDETLPDKIFRAYSNANELDPSQTEGIIHCYREGIGVEKDVYKARGIEMQNASSGGIETKFQVGKEAFDHAETLRATEWLQNALLSDDAGDHPALWHYIRMLLGQIDATDEQGNSIDEDQEFEKLLQLVKSGGNPEALQYWAMITSYEGTEKTLYCSHCGAPMGEDDSFCAYCGNSLMRGAALAPHKQPVPLKHPAPHKQPAPHGANKKRILIAAASLACLIVIGIVVGVFVSNSQFSSSDEPVADAAHEGASQIVLDDELVVIAPDGYKMDDEDYTPNTEYTDNGYLTAYVSFNSDDGSKYIVIDKILEETNSYYFNKQSSIESGDTTDEEVTEDIWQTQVSDYFCCIEDDSISGVLYIDESCYEVQYNSDNEITEEQISQFRSFLENNIMQVQ